MHGCFWLLVPLMVAVTPPPDRPAVVNQQQAQRVGPLAQTIDGIWADAEVATDEAYQARIRRVVDSAVAPRDMREMFLDWPQLQLVSGYPQNVWLAFEQEYLRLLWGADLVCGQGPELAREMFIAKLEKQGYRRLQGEELDAYYKFDPLGPGEWWPAFMRKSGTTELLVSFKVERQYGHRSAVRFRWIARRPYREPPPKLAELLAVLPAWAKLPYLDEKFFTLLGDEPIVKLSSGSDLAIAFAPPITDKLANVLEQIGFKYRHEFRVPGRNEPVRNPQSEGF